LRGLPNGPFNGVLGSSVKTAKKCPAVFGLVRARGKWGKRWRRKSKLGDAMSKPYVKTVPTVCSRGGSMGTKQRGKEKKGNLNCGAAGFAKVPRQSAQRGALKRPKHP